MKKPPEEKNKKIGIEKLVLPLKKPYLEGKIFSEIKKPKKIIFCGMGGSGLGAKLFISLKNYFKIKENIELVQDFENSKVDSHSLVISVSYSGNTKETIFFTKKVYLEKIPLVIVSSDGILLNFAKRNKINYFLLPKNYLPRQTIFYQFFILGEILEKAKVANFWQKIPKFDLRYNLTLSKKIAKRISKKIVLIYSTKKNSHLSYDLKLRLEENALTPAFDGILPEATHNDLAALKFFSDRLFVIFLKSIDDFKKNKKIIKIIGENLKKWHLDFEVISLKEKNPIKRYFSQVILNTLISLNLKKIKKIDQNFQIKFLSEFKKKV